MAWRYRSAVTGHFVSAWYAIRHPRTTIREWFANRQAP